MKNRNIVLTALFLCVIILPSVLFPFLKDSLDSGNHENRTLAEFPVFSNTGVEGFPAAFDEYYIDHLPFKNQFMSLNSLVQMNLFNTTANPRVVVGKDGWLFYNNYDAENPIDDLLGISEFSNEDMAFIERQIRNVKAKYPDKQFVLLIAPNKENIYREYLPEYLEKKAVEETAVDKLYGCLSASGVSADVVYPKAELEAQKNSFQLYYRYDTHWNRLGGYIGASVLLERLGHETPALEMLTVTKGDDYPKDLANLAGLGDSLYNDVEFSLSGIADGIAAVSSPYGDGGIYTRYTSNAADSRKLLLVHDSYYKSMIDYLPLYFSDVVRADRDYSSLHSIDALIAEYDPDIIVMEVVERGCAVLRHEDYPF